MYNIHCLVRNNTWIIPLQQTFVNGILSVDRKYLVNLYISYRSFVFSVTKLVISPKVMFFPYIIRIFTIPEARNPRFYRILPCRTVKSFRFLRIIRIFHVYVFIYSFIRSHIHLVYFSSVYSHLQKFLCKMPCILLPFLHL